MTPRRPRAAVLLACCLLLAGCSGSSSTDATRKKLGGVVLQLSDFPPTWRSYPSSQPDLLAALARCTGDARGAAKQVAQARSGEFRHGRQRITSIAVGYGSDATVGKYLDTLHSPKVDDCMAQVVRQRVLDVSGGTAIDSAHFTVTEGGINVAANVAGSASGVATVAVRGRTVTVYVDVSFLTGPDFYADVTFIGVGSRVSDYIRQVLTNDVAARALRG